MLIFAIIGIGLLAGWLAQLILGRRTNWGEALVAGVLGSFLGGLLFSLIAGDGLEIRLSGLIGTLAGAILILLIWGAIRGRTSSAAHG